MDMPRTKQSGWKRPLFIADNRTIAVRDVIHAAHFRGELQSCWTKLLTLLECAKRAGDVEEVDNDALQSLSEQFRFERDLITGEETESWVEERGLTLQDFSDYFLRHYWREAAGGNVVPEMIDYLAAPEELRDLLRVELLLSGDFDRLAVQLSWRIAAFHFSGKETTPALVTSERSRFLKRFELDEIQLTEWLTGLGCNQTWLNEMLQLEAAYRLQCDSLMTPAARERTLSLLRLPLTRAALETIEVESCDAAREAFLCVSEDDASIAAVASDGRYPYRRTEVVLEDLPAELQRQILCAAPGEVLEPIKQGDSFQVVRLIAKIDADLSNAQVRERVERQILERHFSELAAKCVRWMIPPGSTL